LQESYSINALCEEFEVHRSSYRYWKFNAGKIRVADVHTDSEVKAAHAVSGGSAGARTIATLVTSGGYQLSRYRASKSMKRQGLVSCQPPKHNYKPATKTHIAIKNHLNREFSPISPDQVWCGDVTYLWVGDRWRYLAVVLDLYSRKVVGFALSDSPDSELTKQALSHAFTARGNPVGVMFHSDQGCHYTSLSFKQMIWTYQFKQSMSRRGNCWDNAPMERFFRSMKTENMSKNDYENEAVANDSVRYCNLVRPHSHNLGLSPNEKEVFYWNDLTKPPMI
jgi:putative transposase